MFLKDKMNFSDQSIPQNLLPQFSDITASTTSDYVSNTNNEHLQITQNSVYTTAAESNSSKQTLVNSPPKYSNPLLTWPDPNTLIQLCEKQGIQAPLNIPSTFSQTTAVLNAQSQNVSMKTLSSAYMQASEEDRNSPNNKSQNQNCSTVNSQSLEQQSVVMAEYIQKLQSSASVLPLTLQQLIKIQNEQSKKDKIMEEEKTEQIQNSILNIPNVPTFKNSENQFLNSDNAMMTLNPSDVNVHIEEQPEAHSSVEPSQSKKNEDSTQAEVSKPEKKMKFRAKTGEIKITIALDGSTLYCCPECSLAFAQKSDIEQHLQIHIQERKYQCKECGAMLKRKEHLDQHMRGHSDERPFKCPACPKSFKRNEHLTRHYVIHSGDKNFTCTVCQKAFSRKDHLNKHAQTHLGIKKTKVKKEVIFVDANKDYSNMSEKAHDNSTSSLSRQDINSFLRDNNLLKAGNTEILHQLQSLQKESNIMQTFSAFLAKDGSSLQQQAVNMSEILPQNTRYMMPS